MNLPGATPTVDKYFLGPMAPHVARSGFPLPRLNVFAGANKPVRQLGPHLFATASHAVLLRHCTPDEFRILDERRFPAENVHYVIDDDLKAISEDPAVPDSYRIRTRTWMTDDLPRILELCGQIIAPAREILSAYGSHEHRLLTPCMLKAGTSFRHHERKGPFRIIYAGTGSHAADLEMIAPALAGFCAAHEDVRLVTFLGKHAPASLQGHKRIRHHNPLRWPLFRAYMEHARFHAALAPMRETPVNRARSINKILDHALLGAAGIYSAGACPQIDQAVEDGKNGLLAASAPGEWRDALETLYANRDMTRDIAINGASSASILGAPAPKRAFWKQALDLPD